MLCTDVQLRQLCNHAFHYASRAVTNTLQVPLCKQRFPGFRLQKFFPEVTVMSAAQVNYQMIGFCLGPGLCGNLCSDNGYVMNYLYRNRVGAMGGVTCGINRNGPLRIIYTNGMIFKKRVAEQRINLESRGCGESMHVYGIARNVMDINRTKSGGVKFDRGNGLFSRAAARSLYRGVGI